MLTQNSTSAEYGLFIHGLLTEILKLTPKTMLNPSIVTTIVTEQFQQNIALQPHPELLTRAISDILAITAYLNKKRLLEGVFLTEVKVPLNEKINKMPIGELDVIALGPKKQFHSIEIKTGRSLGLDNLSTTQKNVQTYVKRVACKKMLATLVHLSRHNIHAWPSIKLGQVHVIAIPPDQTGSIISAAHKPNFIQLEKYAQRRFQQSIRDILNA